MIPDLTAEAKSAVAVGSTGLLRCPFWRRMLWRVPQRLLPGLTKHLSTQQAKPGVGTELPLNVPQERLNLCLGWPVVELSGRSILERKHIVEPSLNFLPTQPDVQDDGD